MGNSLSNILAGDLYNHQSRDVIGDTPIYDNFTGKMWFKFSRGQNWIANSETKLA